MRNVRDNCPDPPKDAFEKCGKWTSRTYTISLITPLFGGGASPGENDPVTLIRGSSIRGHLRFWWRATRGASFETVNDLRHREGEIWGTAKVPSPVVVRVGPVRNHEEKPWQTYRDSASPAIRGVLDLVTRDTARTSRSIVLTTSACFDLTVAWLADKDLDEDIEASLWAWVNFGGLGARTRRGCGSLFCSELSPAAQDLRSVQQWFSLHLREYRVSTDHVRAWPTLPEKLLTWCGNGAKVRPLDPLDAWSKSVGVLSRFRQALGVARQKKADGKPGRSFWPEADSLRRVTGQSFPKHARSITTQTNAFPRAEFGLPIVFHFKDGPGKGQEGTPDKDPVDCQLLPLQTNRMASPLILKPLAVEGNQAIPIILQLKTMSLTGVRVQFGPTSCEFGTNEIRRPDLAMYPNSPMKDRSAKGSALEAFLKFAREEGFRYE